MKLKLLIILSIVLLSCNDSTRSNYSNKFGKINLEAGNSCNYSGVLNIKSAYSFKSDSEADKALKRIMRQTGLPTNFALVASDVDNAAAVIYENKRYILYNQRFMEDVFARTRSEFGALSILAHEIGHHLSGHTLIDEGSRPDLELEADRFSGFILAKMGATINQACLAMDTYGSEEASNTHPAKRSRIAAISNGWKEAREDIITNTVTEVVSVNKSNKLYVIEVIGDLKYITLRNRSLSPEEFRLGHSSTPEGEKLNKETIIRNLPNGSIVEVLSSINKTYYIKVKINNTEIYGYIAKLFKGQPTIRKYNSR